MFPTRICLIGLFALMMSETSLSGQQQPDKAVKNRVDHLLAILATPGAREGDNLKRTVETIKELTKIGAPAAPQLVAALLEEPAASNVSFTSGLILLDIGKPALPAVTARWSDLNDAQRWRLMPFREKYDRDAVREYVWNCLASDYGFIRFKAWEFIMRHPDPRAKDRYLNALHGMDREQGGEDAGLRWYLFPGKTVYDEKQEIGILIDLLKSDSWVAKGDGEPPRDGFPPPWWPDGRPTVVRLLHSRKITQAAPALLKLLQEKGQGAGYLVEQIVPVLVAFKYTEAIPELERIAASKPIGNVPQDPDRHPYAVGGHKAVQKLAVDAAKKLSADRK
ncbi:MAG: hypothetical protein K8U57_40280 [Planctomycetes bacterium]|nr:hypothetical protein [Planctomycetota bacterium]